MVIILALLTGIAAVEALALTAGSNIENVLIIGGTRFSGLYLWKELYDRGYSVTLFNRGKTTLGKVPGETEATFQHRLSETQFITGDRNNREDLNKLKDCCFDAVFDMNGRSVEDTAPVADMFNGKVEHYVYMSSAGIYKKSHIMPHHEDDLLDINSRHKGKLQTEGYLHKIGIPYTAIRPTYIYGAMNYSPLEEYFFARLEADRPVCIPGHGQHVTGLGHVRDLACAMAQVLGREHAKGQAYNIQDVQSVTFDGLAQLCGQAMGKQDPVTLRHYDSAGYDFGTAKPFPLREQHFFCSVEKAMRDLDWAPHVSLLDGLRESYQQDFLPKMRAGKVATDFRCDDKVLGTASS